ncbi:hypothetical protein LCGC14_2611340 [marine sediment metagenome]|uniref:Uncharacterized protein n=1 Tax=marine sediment metagenome TaxID=412755 RepID=A0A0F9ATE7_9ZZZZ
MEFHYIKFLKNDCLELTLISSMDGYEIIRPSLTFTTTLCGVKFLTVICDLLKK